MSRMLPRHALLGIISCMPMLAYAQRPDSTKQLQEVVVTGQYKPQSLKNSVYQVRVINSERIRLRAANNVLQVLNNELGFRFSNDNTLGTTDVQLMGMSGRNVKILLDGVPMVDRGDTRESLAQVDVNSIERIEIVEGPMSVSYGSDALAGVINIVTKKTGTNTWTINAKAQEETAGSEYHPFSYKGLHQQSVNIGWQQKGWSISGGGSHIDASGFGGNEYGRQKTWKPKEQWLGNIRLGWSNAKFSAYYRLDGLDETIVSRGKMGLNYRAIDQRYLTDRFLHQLQANWHINERAQINTILSYTDYKRRTKTVEHDFTTGAEKLTTGAGEQDLAKFNSQVFRTTLQYKITEKVSLQPGIDINREEASGQRIKGQPAITDYAFFVSSEIKPTSAINIRPGLRFIKNSVYDAPPAIPSINAKFALNKQLDLRLAYAYGFRSPALRELYFDFHDASHDIVGNPDLKAENSNSFNGSLTWSSVVGNNIQFKSVLGGFYNDFKNLITYAVDPNNTAQYKNVNIDRFKTTGGTWENTIQWKNLQATLGFSYIGRYNQLSEDQQFKNENLPSFVWSPEINSNIIYTWEKIGTSLSLFYKFTGKQPGYQVGSVNGQDVIQLSKVSDYSWADFTASKNIYKWFTVSAGVKNIFDVTTLSNTATGGGAHTSGAAVPMSYGRSYFLGLAFQWSKK
jgi:outer membrane receptor for ferrienterochelin and colicins